ncbi:UNKNOWN [Stylonychia lemnae]|uniref:Uncharacterized protein n=1 Tax=Stylonychia lemnae TaxID=5949 RepID=A0A078ABK3_STYLE|nr:UNKNOWN [Stylonychia lemnae]|eukprot:CDW78163.1 UNKNOWN [Stylonychia lemnae]
MADEICSIITAVRNEQTDPDRSGLVNSYLDIVEQTVTSQHQIILNYEELVKKLENQLITCQQALDESTKREIEQIGLIMEMKMASAKAHLDGGKDSDQECETCEAYEQENKLLTQQNEQQQEIIEKLGQAQDLLMLQYKMLELGMDNELKNIQLAQEEIEALKGGAADGEDQDEENKEKENEEKQDQDAENNGDSDLQETAPGQDVDDIKKDD